MLNSATGDDDPAATLGHVVVCWLSSNQQQTHNEKETPIPAHGSSECKRGLERKTGVLRARRAFVSKAYPLSTQNSLRKYSVVAPSQEARYSVEATNFAGGWGREVR